MIQRLFSFIVLIEMILVTYGQAYDPLSFSPYAGSLNLSTQPARLASTPYKVHVNLFSASVAINARFNEISSNPYATIFNGNLFSLAASSKSTNVDFFAIGEIGFPSAVYKINEKSGIGFTWRLRGVCFGTSSLTEVNLLSSGNRFNLSKLYNIPNIDNLSGVLNTWQEYGISYGRNIWTKGNHKIDLGANLKYLAGGVSGFFEVNDLSIIYDGNNNEIKSINGDVTIIYNSELENISKDNLSDIFKSSGIGLDFNIAYEYTSEKWAKSKKKMASTYLLSVSSGVSDIGKIHFTPAFDAGKYSLSLRNPIDGQYFNEAETFNDIVEKVDETFNLDKTEDNSYQLRIPTSWNLYLDYHFATNLYASFSSNLIGIDPRVNFFESKKNFNYRCGLRFEKQLYGIYSQIGYQALTGLTSAIAFRYSFLYLGVSNLRSALSNSTNKTLGISFSLNVPILDKKTKNRHLNKID